MKIYLCEDYAAMSRKAAHLLAAQIRLKPDSVLGLATGSTPIGAYRQLIEWYEQGDVDFSQVCSINLDEYAGLSPQHDQSYRWFMQHHLFDHVNIDPARTHLPNGLADDPEAECRRYDEVIATHGPVDLQVLGMGHNGHIGFNEPDDHFPLETHKVDLAQSTIDANARFFASADEVPRQALTMGIKTIMQAKKVLVVVSGKDKAEIVKKAFTGPVTPQVPASILQMHSDVILVADEAAASLL
jgi:glucosamine-6-phosphate deaminase